MGLRPDYRRPETWALLIGVMVVVGLAVKVWG
jgi:hypothetical protein